MMTKPTKAGRPVGSKNSALPEPLIGFERRLTTDELAHYFRVSRVTVEAWRLRGEGPRFLKVGNRILYRHADVLAFEESRLRTSTSEAAAA